jgi:phosphoglycerol transferase
VNFGVRAALAAGFFVVAFFLVAMVSALPWTAPDKPGLLFLLCLIAGFSIVGRAVWGPRPWAFWLIPLAAALLVPAVALSRSFRRIDMLAIVFHRDFGMQGATLVGLETQILQGVLCGLGLILVFWGLSSLGRWRTWHFGMAALVIMLVNPVVQFFVVSQLRAAVPSDLAERLVEPRLRPVTPQRLQPDVLVIYLEGTDRQFADPAVWGDVYAPLTDFAARGMTFTRVGQIAGTGWSLAGIVSTQCGVPIVARGVRYVNNFSDVDAFMPAVTCLGDILATRGYAAAYVVGGDLGFGGLGVFFRTHQVSDVTGKAELEAVYPPTEISAALIGWILDDQMVFDFARGKLAMLQGRPEPFALFVETIGPHGHDGYLSRRCTDEGRAAFSRDARRVLNCTITDTLAFVEHAQAEQARLRPDRPLAVVLLSDHINNDPRTPSVDAEYAGYNTVIMVGAGAKAGRVVTKPGSMIDVLPTMLDWFDWAEGSVAAGLGRSLLGDGPTIVEQHGIDALDSMITTDVALANRIWAAGQP